ncbi:hypothetical protein Mal35_09050 [Gimesia maris]|uniref:hypothetical protein n=1 Tax=Gimesia maris TaxID=122 RepID=UPI001187C406|nr:hypothetical protein [Gimesia maris]QDT77479.1 hypothetical protein Mal35_09050 [Gimesia maris]
MRFSKLLSSRTGLLLLLLTLVVPVILWLLFEATLPFLIAFLTVPVILMAVWHDPGFLIGGIFFWVALVAWGESSVQADRVDNLLPGVTMILGWVPYVIFYGPIFLFIKSNNRYREKWGGTSSAVISDRLD